ncbi:MAG TPA: phosphoglycerate mutase [Oxalobacteraceae bacterium]|nr:phosphoglycerate mutase [Oxalobacteraceae bacterium]
MRLLLVRHPQPLVAPGVCYGSTDLTIAPDELARVVSALSATLPKNVPLFSSPLRRCAQLATRLKCTSLTFDARLVEMDFGQWEMRRWDDIPRAEIDAWAEDVAAYRPGGGESVIQMTGRIAAFYDELICLQQECAAIICHAGTMRVLAACQTGLSLPEMALLAARTPHKIDYGQTIILDC